MNKDFDVIVVGGGGAGLAAAIIAKKAGASCMVLEADKKLGGAHVGQDCALADVTRRIRALHRGLYGTVGYNGE